MPDAADPVVEAAAGGDLASGPPPDYRRGARRTALGALGLLLVIQLVPYGWRHPNPPVVRDAPWPDAESEAIARRACYDCHSNESKWPAYAYVAPASWLVRYDVDEARAALNFSDWGRYADRAADAADAVLAGRMPQSRYTLIHRRAKLSDDEVSKLSGALGQMSRGAGSGGGDGG